MIRFQDRYGVPMDSTSYLRAIAQLRLDAINWLWVGGAAIATWIIVNAISGRQDRLTEVLRRHVKKFNDSQIPPEPEDSEAE